MLVEHGRWTRGVTMTNEGEDEIVLRMVESESILAYSEEKPDDVQMSNSRVGDYAMDSIDPSGFVNA